MGLGCCEWVGLFWGLLLFMWVLELLVDLTWFLLCGFGGAGIVDLCVDLVVGFWVGGFWWLGGVFGAWVDGNLGFGGIRLGCRQVCWFGLVARLLVWLG